MSADNPAPQGKESPSEGQAAAGAAGADQWAKAVVDGMPADPANPPSPSAETSNGDAAAEPSSVDEEDRVASEGRAHAESDQTEVDPAPEHNPVREHDTATGDAAVADEENPDGDISVEDLVIDLERVTTERDQYLDASRRLQAEFENYKKQVLKREIEARERANDSLVGELLPVLDAFDGAVANGAEDVSPMRATFLDALGKHGLERIDPAEAPFDPTLHEAVMHEDASDTDGPVVAEVMRAGYVWKGRVLRPAMVRTRG